MITTTAMLIEQLSSYRSPKNKIGRLVDAGELIPLRRGLYETDASTPGHLLAASIYGPSYLSFEYALARHGLIPEAVRTYTSATCEKRKSKRYETPFGRFEYQDVPVRAFPLEVECFVEQGYQYWMATPEKALCDELYKLKPLANERELDELLFDDLRIDSADIPRLDASTIAALAERYRCRNVKMLAKRLERMHS